MGEGAVTDADEVEGEELEGSGEGLSRSMGLAALCLGAELVTSELSEL